jgi:hypothetical protein
MTRQEAQLRNHKIMRLRGMWGTAPALLSSSRAKIIQTLIDEELIELGALSTAKQRQKERQKLGILQ